MSEICNIVRQLRTQFLKLHNPNKEIGCNIYYDGREKFYLDDFVEGSDKEVDIPDNPFIVGTFHTHVKTDWWSWEFSTADIKGAVDTKERYMFLLVEKDLYGVDLRGFRKYVNKYKQKQISLKKLTKKINQGKWLF